MSSQDVVMGSPLSVACTMDTRVQTCAQSQQDKHIQAHGITIWTRLALVSFGDHLSQKQCANPYGLHGMLMASLVTYYH